MQLHVAFSIFFIGFSGCALANQLNVDGITEGSAQHSSKITTQSSQSSSVLSVLLYFPLIDNAAWSNIMAQSQLTVTPTATYTVRAIKVTTWNSTNGSCTNISGSCNIDNGSGITVSLTNGHPYATTDASNSAFYNSCVPFYTTKDNTYQLLDNNLNPIGASVCIPASGACTGATNCGWSTPQTWTP